MNTNFKKLLNVIAVVALAATMSSCYKIIRTQAPAKVNVGDSYVGRIVVADDGSSNQSEKKVWSYFAVRVPEAWDVTVGAGSCRAYAEDWVYFSDGTKISRATNMKFNQKYSDFLNETHKKEGYKWVGFQSTNMNNQHMTACWRNGNDSVAVSFSVKVNGAPGEYVIDYATGDEEDAQGIAKYETASAAASTRCYHSATVSNRFDNTQKAWASKIIVEDPSGVSSVVITENAKVLPGVYTLQGAKISNTNSTEGLPSGIYIVNGKKVIVR